MQEAAYWDIRHSVIKGVKGALEEAVYRAVEGAVYGASGGAVFRTVDEAVQVDLELPALQDFLHSARRT